jgi:putative oxidoreductase
VNTSFNASIAVLGRVLLALMFVWSGFVKLTGITATAGLIASVGLPAPAVLAVLTGLLEVVGGVGLIVGYKTRLAALALGLFTLAASLLFHAYWSAPADQQFVQQLFFMKNLAVIGGMFIVTALGGGSLSVDARRRPDASFAGATASHAKS